MQWLHLDLYDNNDENYDTDLRSQCCASDFKVTMTLTILPWNDIFFRGLSEHGSKWWSSYNVIFTYITWRENVTSQSLW